MEGRILQRGAGMMAVLVVTRMAVQEVWAVAEKGLAVEVMVMTLAAAEKIPAVGAMTVFTTLGNNCSDALALDLITMVSKKRIVDGFVSLSTIQEKSVLSLTSVPCSLPQNITTPLPPLRRWMQRLAPLSSVKE